MILIINPPTAYSRLAHWLAFIWMPSMQNLAVHYWARLYIVSGCFIYKDYCFPSNPKPAVNASGRVLKEALFLF